MEGGGKGDLSPRRKRFGQEHLYDIDVLGMVLDCCLFAVDTEIETVDVSPLLRSREIEVGFAVLEALFGKGRTVVLESVWPAEDPNVEEGIGGVVGILQTDRAIEGVVGVVEADVYMVVDLLVPIEGGISPGGLGPRGKPEEAEGEPE